MNMFIYCVLRYRCAVKKIGKRLFTKYIVPDTSPMGNP